MVQLSEKNGLVLTVTPFEVNLPWKGFLFCTLGQIVYYHSANTLELVTQELESHFSRKLDATYKFRISCFTLNVSARALTGSFLFFCSKLE